MYYLGHIFLYKIANINPIIKQIYNMQILHFGLDFKFYLLFLYKINSYLFNFLIFF